MMILLLLKRGLEHVGYFDAFVSLHKDLSVHDYPGHTVQPWGLYGYDFSCLKDLKWRKNGLTRWV
jgi:hypothetical protein